jgi:hypothetical protein
MRFAFFILLILIATTCSGAEFEFQSAEYISSGGNYPVLATVVRATTGEQYVLSGWVDVPARGTKCIVIDGKITSTKER